MQEVGGKIKDYKIESIDFNPFTDDYLNNEVIRPIPLKLINLSKDDKVNLIMNGRCEMVTWYPDYSILENKETCLVI